MNKIRETFKANVVSLKIQKLVIKEKCSTMLAHARACSLVFPQDHESENFILN